MKRKFIHYLPYCAVMAAATFIFTNINFILPVGTGQGTLMHLGAAMAVAIAFLLPPVYGALSVAVGMALYDIMSPWAAWAPFTFVIRFSQVFVLSYFINKTHHKTFHMIIGLLFAAIIDVGGYYLAEVLLYGNWIVPFANVPAEVMLNLLGIALGLPAGLLLKRAKIMKMIK